MRIIVRRMVNSSISAAVVGSLSSTCLLLKKKMIIALLNPMNFGLDKNLILLMRGINSQRFQGIVSSWFKSCIRIAISLLKRVRYWVVYSVNTAITADPKVANKEPVVIQSDSLKAMVLSIPMVGVMLLK